MSRVFDALQKSQGEGSSASPLAHEPVSADATATAAATEFSVAVAEEGPSGMPEIPSMAASRIPSGRTADGKWLNVPADRVLHPHPRPEQRLVSIAEPDSPGAEMFRVLSTRLAHMQRKRRLQKLLITSSEGDEGKSVVTTNLAFSIAKRSNERVLLIEADLRRPSASALLTDSPLQGITEWSEGKLAIENALYRVGDLPLWFLSAGHGIEDPMPLLESERFAQMLDSVSTSFDWVLLDATPLLPMADSTSLARLCDGVLVVVREGYTRIRVLNKALGSVEKHKLVGMVLNQASMLKVGYDRYYGSKNGKSKKEVKAESDQVTAVTA